MPLQGCFISRKWDPTRRTFLTFTCSPLAYCFTLLYRGAFQFYNSSLCPFAMSDHVRPTVLLFHLTSAIACAALLLLVGCDSFAPDPPFQSERSDRLRFSYAPLNDKDSPETRRKAGTPPPSPYVCLTSVRTPEGPHRYRYQKVYLLYPDAILEDASGPPVHLTYRLHVQKDSSSQVGTDRSTGRMARCRLPASPRAARMLHEALRYHGSGTVIDLTDERTRQSAPKIAEESSSNDWREELWEWAEESGLWCTQHPDTGPGTGGITCYNDEVVVTPGDGGTTGGAGDVPSPPSSGPWNGGSGGGNSGGGTADPCSSGSEDGPCHYTGYLTDYLKANPFALLDVPCDQIPKYVDLANLKVPQSVLATIEDLDRYGISGIQRLQNAAGAVVNMDEFGVTMTVGDIPGGRTPRQFLREIRSNLNQYTDRPGVHFTEVLGSMGSGDPLGTVVSISLDPTGGWLDEGTVVVSDRSRLHWTFSTVYTTFDGYHPVSGNRRFGFERSGNKVTFYTRGIDRMTTTLDRIANVGQLAFGQADALWRSFQQKIKEATNGKAEIVKPLTYRPDWSEVEGVINGNTSISALNGCNRSRMITRNIK